MILTLKERLYLLELLPAQGNILTLKALRVLKEALAFTEDEEKKCEITGEINEETGTVVYKWKKDVDADIEISQKMSVLITEKLEDMEKKEELTENQISLFEKFCETE